MEQWIDTYSCLMKNRSLFSGMKNNNNLLRTAWMHEVHAILLIEYDLTLLLSFLMEWLAA